VSLNGVHSDKLASGMPDRLLAVRYVRRAAGFWVAVHLFLGVVSGGVVLALDPPAALLLFAIAGGLGVFDATKRHELLFLQNLGVPRSMVAVLWIATAATLELSAHLVSLAVR